MKHDLIANKNNAIAFYQTAYLGNPRAAVDQYVGAEYIQHKPLVKNGKTGFIDYFEAMQQAYPDKTISFIRAVAEDDLVALHTCQHWPGDQAYVTMDFLGLMIKVKLLDTGIRFEQYLKQVKMVI